MKLVRLVQASNAVAATRARRTKVSELAACLAELGPGEVEIGVAFLSGEPRQGRIGVGYGVLRALETPAAEAATLDLVTVDAVFARIANLRGGGSNAERERALHTLFAECTHAEQDFLRRLLLGELRQGALEGIMLDAIEKAYSVPGAAVRRATMLSGRAGEVAAAAREAGVQGIERFKLELFRPLQPMLAQSAADVGEALARLRTAAFEWKLDGARVQVHKQGDEVKVFTRTGNDVTAAVPEVVLAAQRLPARSLVLDGEAIALAPDRRPLPFQVTMRRFGRKLDVERLRAELPLSVFFFDVLHADGEDVLDRKASERAQILQAIVPDALRVERALIADEAAGEAFLARALDAGHEGVVAKSLESPYEAGRRGAGWLKLKRAHTLDLVVLAAEWGSGRREGWLSNLHLGARADNGEFVMLGKTFKGMTDELLAWQTRELLAREVQRDAYTVYVRPELVVEIAFDGLQESSTYPGGLALRFARVKRYRPDKRAQDADTIERVRAIAALARG